MSCNCGCVDTKPVVDSVSAVIVVHSLVVSVEGQFSDSVCRHHLVVSVYYQFIIDGGFSLKYMLVC